MAYSFANNSFTSITNSDIANNSLHDEFTISAWVNLRSFNINEQQNIICAGLGDDSVNLTTKYSNQLRLGKLVPTFIKSDLGYGFSINLDENGFIKIYGNILDTIDENNVTTSSFLTNIVDVAAGSYHALVLKSDGSLYGIGRNAEGQLFGNNTPSTVNDSFFLISGSNSNIIAIAAGGNHSLALKNDGTILEWGNTYYPSPYTYLNISQPSMTNIVKIACGNSHNMALKNDGTVYVWGKTKNDPDDQDYTGVYPVPTLVNDSEIIDIAGGKRVCHVLSSSRELIGWGTASNGITTGIVNDYGPGLVKVNGNILNNVKHITRAGDNTAIAVLQNNTYVTWSRDPVFSPEQVAAFPNSNINYVESSMVSNFSILYYDHNMNGSNGPYNWTTTGNNAKNLYYEGYISSSTPMKVGSSAGIPLTNTWQHIVLTAKQNESMSLYVDGEKTSISLGTMWTDWDRYYISCPYNINVGGTYSAFTHSLSDVCIWNKRLTDTEIRTIYLSKEHQIAPQIHPDNVLIYMPMNDYSYNESGSYFVDHSGNQLNISKASLSPSRHVIGNSDNLSYP